MARLPPLDFPATASIAHPVMFRSTSGRSSARHPLPGVLGLAVVKALHSRRVSHRGRTMTASHKRSPRHLSDTALILLGRVADSEDQMILPIPKTVRARGKALERTLRSLLNQGSSVGPADEAWRSDDEGRFGLRITEAGLQAISVPALESGLGQPTAPRPGSKLARLITMLMQPGGRSVDELAASLGWQVHTTRAVISRLQKCGHVVVRERNDAGQSVYRIEASAEATASDQDA
jgi:hypothetical protein